MTCHECGREPVMVQSEYYDFEAHDYRFRPALEEFYTFVVDGDSVRVCRNCSIDYWRCRDCSEYFSFNRVSPANYGRCPDCEDQHEEARDMGDCDCDVCLDERDSRDRLVKGYSYKPRPVFHGDGPLYLGPELEVAVSGGPRYRMAAQLANDHLGELGYLKEDGSVPGFEIVTHPMSFAWAQDHFPWSMLGELHRAGARPSEDCGMHVHASKAGFSDPAHVYRWMMLFHRNSPKIRTMARRDSHYARFERDDRFMVKHYAKGSMGRERYVAINTQNRDTYEVRVFASTLDPAQVEANLGLVDASIRYASEIDAQAVLRHGAWQWGSFADWVSDHKQYRALRDKMEDLRCVS